MNNVEYRPVSVGNWILTFILISIPLVNVIMLIVWAVGGTTHPSKKTFAQACWVLFIIYVIIGIVAAIILPNYIHHPAKPVA